MDDDLQEQINELVESAESPYLDSHEIEPEIDELVNSLESLYLDLPKVEKTTEKSNTYRTIEQPVIRSSEIAKPIKNLDKYLEESRQSRKKYNNQRPLISINGHFYERGDGGIHHLYEGKINGRKVIELKEKRYVLEDFDEKPQGLTLSSLSLSERISESVAS